MGSSNNLPKYDPQTLLNSQPVIVCVIDPATYTVQFQNETGLKKFGDISNASCHEKNRRLPGTLQLLSHARVPGDRDGRLQ